MIIKLVLENFITLLKNGITKFELNEINAVNIFISVNGSGKTSILKELNPLPAENGNYDKGRKYVEVLHQGVLYKLESRTGVGNGHSFITVDSKGNELEHNPNGTFTVQKDLVYQHLGIDQRIVKVLGGLKVADRFSSMSANARKDLLMQIYPNDTKYSLGVYNKLRTERNELKAVIKNQTIRYAEENKKLEHLEGLSIEQLEENIKYLEKELRECLLIRGEINNAKLHPNKQDKINRFNYLTEALTLDKVNSCYLTKDELLSRIVGLDRLLYNYTREADIVKSELADKRSSVEGMEDLINNPDVYAKQLEIIAEDKQIITTRLEQIETGLINYPLFKDLDQLKGLDTVLEDLMEYIGRVTIASSEKVTGGEYRKLEQLKETTTNKLKADKALLESKLHKLKHYEAADVIECPDCTSKFKVGIKPEDIQMLKLKIDALTEGITRNEKLVKELTDKLDLDLDWFQSMNQLFSFIRANRHITNLPEVIKLFDIGRVESDHALNTLKLLQEKFNLTNKLTTLLEEEKVVEGRLSYYNKSNIVDVAKHLNNLEIKLHDLNTYMISTKKELEATEAQLRVIETYQERLFELKSLREEILNILKEEGEYKFKAVVDRKINDLTEEKNKCLADIISNRSLDSVVKTIGEELEKSKKRLEIVEVLINGLCPNKGLIGKQMTDFNEAICANVNAILKEIWDSKLIVKPCSKENGDLTYKFPVITEDGNPTPDISDCSGGETDIIDWAFRMVFLNYVDFQFPLIMDEVGTYLDEIKRSRFSEFMQEYTDSKEARQLFMVSHYFVQYAIFKDANLIGLKYDGLSLPGKINTNVNIS